MTIYPEVS